MSNNVTVANVPKQLPRTFLYRTDIVNTINLVHYHYIMDSFGNQIKNTSTEFVLRLYEITKRSVNMSILKLEEGIGLARPTGKTYLVRWVLRAQGLRSSPLRDPPRLKQKGYLQQALIQVVFVSRKNAPHYFQGLVWLGLSIFSQLSY